MIGDSHVTRLARFQSYHRIDQTRIEFYAFSEATIPIVKTFIKQIIQRKWVYNIIGTSYDNNVKPNHLSLILLIRRQNLNGKFVLFELTNILLIRDKPLIIDQIRALNIFINTIKVVEVKICDEISQ